MRRPLKQKSLRNIAHSNNTGSALADEEAIET